MFGGETKNNPLDSTEILIQITLFNIQSAEVKFTSCSCQH